MTEDQIQSTREPPKEIMVEPRKKLEPFRQPNGLWIAKFPGGGQRPNSLSGEWNDLNQLIHAINAYNNG